MYQFFHLVTRVRPDQWFTALSLRKQAQSCESRASLLAAGGIKSEAFQPSLFPRRPLCGEFDYDADPIEVVTKVQSVIDALRQPPNAPA